MWKSPAKWEMFWQPFKVNSLEMISERARELIASGEWELDSAINRAVDEAYESGQVEDLPGLQSQIRNSLLGFGKLDELLADRSVEEIWINSPSEIFYSRNSATIDADLELSEYEVRQLVERMLRDSGRRLDRATPFVDATLKDGSRLHVVIPEVTKKHWAVNIRKFPTQLHTLTDLVNFGSVSPDLAEKLSVEFRAGKNILISGATQAGKTTLLCALLDLGKDSERLISVEETFEIKTNYRDHVALQARQSNLEGEGEITLRRLVKEALRMRPTRLVIGEVRQAEALDLLIALNSGISGLCTIHANSAFEALEKLKLLPLLAGENIPAAFVQETVDRSIDLVVHCQLKHGRRSVAQVLSANRSGSTTSWIELAC